ncbi:dihydrolipoyl dehydrogenase [Thalassospira sp. MCCC 1A01428]|uniref:dihydrolipoyl dehydrogenase n=1 Tax=Thalassospira sp. MCCC 1A01428 TaxID=1470575 RepID=UPI000A1DEC05|nr:dihydrolipoyl dehydrogenase [Thalassospira sp. MCCC 1A01428]OSQ43114.1 dihydrolipoamide dehydrogenase [Thalassospira sp. MCCC 1A01428]
MAKTQQADFVVLGAGPGGYACAFRAADLGRDVLLIDPRPQLGGVCLNEGCIPSKALLHVAQIIRESRAMADWGVAFTPPRLDLAKLRDRKDSVVRQLTGGLGQLARKRHVKTVQGTAQFTGPNQVRVTSRDGDREIDIHFKDAVIAVGSRPVKLPGWPEDNRIMDSTKALALPTIPNRLAIVGGGIIGLEMATVYSALGSDVTIIELGEQIIPGADRDAVRILHKALQEHGCTVQTTTRVCEVNVEKSHISLVCTGGFDGTITADAVIQAVGRIANGDKIACEAVGIRVSDRGEIDVDAQCRTGQAGIYAIGDVTGAPMLAHRATHQGKVAAETACQHAAAMAENLVPSVVYTDPELAWVGIGQQQAKDQDIAHKTTSFPWAASGRNLASNGNDGLTKLVYCPQTNRVLGACIVGANAGELIGELVLAIEMGATLEDIALTIHAHPTLSETIAFAAERALGTLTDL